MKVLDNYQCEGQITIFEILNPDTWCGKTYQEPLVQTKERTSDVSLKKFAELKIKPPQYLCLKRENGVVAVASWVTGGALLGDYTMRSFGEYPSEEKESRLSQILEDNPHPKYCLSEKACQGILNRANRRGKKLPEQLEQALIRQASHLKSGGGVERDSKGNKAGKGALVQTELSGTLGVSQDQTLIKTNCLNSWDVQSKHIQPENGKAESLYSGECRGGGGGESYVMQGVDLYNQKVTGDVVAPLTCNSNATSTQPTVMQETYQETTGALMASGYDKLGTQKAMNDMYVIGKAYDGSDVSPTLTANNANGSQRMPDKDNFNAVITPIVLEGNGSRESHRGNGYKESETMYSLNTVEQHGVCYGIDAYNQSASEEVAHPIRSNNADTDHVPNVCYGLDRASFNQGKNALYDFSVEEEKAQPLVARGPWGVLTGQSEHCAQEITKE